VIILGEMRDCDDCKDPTKKRVGTAFDIAGPGSVSPVWDCENKRCKKRNNIHMSYLLNCEWNRKEEGAATHE
jgi:hypothetical protein